MGYEIENFVSEIADEFLCSICTMVLEDPRQSSCEHIFCNDCIKGWLNVAENGKARCPVDTCWLALHDIKPTPRYFRNVLHKFKVKCEFEPKGCQAVIPLEQLKRHRTECGFNLDAVVICNKGCNIKITRREYEGASCFTHLTNWQQDQQQKQVDKVANGKVDEQHEKLKKVTDGKGEQQQEQLLKITDRQREQQQKQLNKVIDRRGEEQQKQLDKIAERKAEKQHEQLVQIIALQLQQQRKELDKIIDRQQQEIKKLNDEVTSAATVIQIQQEEITKFSDVVDQQVVEITKLTVEGANLKSKISINEMTDRQSAIIVHDNTYRFSIETNNYSEPPLIHYGNKLKILNVDAGTVMKIELNDRGHQRTTTGKNIFRRQMECKNGDVINCGIKLPEDSTNNDGTTAELYLFINEQLIFTETVKKSCDGFFAKDMSCDIYLDASYKADNVPLLLVFWLIFFFFMALYVF